VVARTEPAVGGAWTIELGADAATARAIQKSAAAHASQSQALPELVPCLELFDGREHPWWPISPHRTPERYLTRRLHRVSGERPQN